MDKTYYTYDNMKAAAHSIIRQLSEDDFKPDYIVGLNRGGLMLSVMISHYLNVNHYALDVRLRDTFETLGPESNCWMSEDAYGYHQAPKKILIVDDINDSGETMKWIKHDWKSTCMPKDPKWDDVWGKTVRTAVMVDNLASDFETNYSAIEINKAEDPVWIVFPYEEWWK